MENLYGPTEATIAITHYRWDPAQRPSDDYAGIVPIGWPFDMQRAVVMDAEGREVATGEAGEPMIRRETRAC